MDLMLLRMFQVQARDQCHFFLLAVDDLNQGLRMINEAEQGDWTTREQGQNRLWYGVQNSLIAAANLSKLFWGAGARYTVERELLRLSLNVADTSPLTTTTMRNHWEHVDERLDVWDSTSQHHNHVDRIVGPPSAISGIDAIDTFRWFDPTTSNLIFWGDQFDLQALANEISRIHPLADAESAKPHWEL